MKKNAKTENFSADDQISFASTVAEHPLILWAVENGKILLYSLLALTILTVLGYRLYSSSVKHSETNYLNAEKEYTQFASAPNNETQEEQKIAFEKLSAILSSQPELHAKYDGLLAQTLLIKHEDKQALQFANAAIDRTGKENDPFYTSYAKNTMVISAKEYENALKNALELKNKMIAQADLLKETPEKIEFGTLLYALNLLRIGLLQQELSLSNDEMKTWQEWKGLSQKESLNSAPSYIDGNLFASFDKLLGSGQFAFADYIKEREKLLK